MTDAEKRIREALAAGPTPGPWTVMPANAGEQCVARINAWESVPPNGVELAHDTIDAAFIAACNPAAIRELLAERDALLEALQHMQHCASCAEDYWQNCEGGRAALAAIDAAKGRA